MKYTVTVKTGTSQEKVTETAPGELTVYLRAKPHDGEANVALVKLLAKHFNVSKSSIAILHGQKSHTKIVDVIS